MLTSSLSLPHLSTLFHYPAHSSAFRKKHIHSNHEVGLHLSTLRAHVNYMLMLYSSYSLFEVTTLGQPLEVGSHRPSALQAPLNAVLIQTGPQDSDGC
jgi:hypothetical protein